MSSKDCSLRTKINKKPQFVWQPGASASLQFPYEVCPEDGANGYFESFATPEHIK